MQLEKDIHSFKPLLNTPTWSFQLFDNQLFAGTNQSLYQIKGTETKELFNTADVIYSIGYSDKFPNHLFLGLRAGIRVIELKPTTNDWFTAKEVYKGSFDEFKYNFKRIISDQNGNLWGVYREPWLVAYSA